MENNRDNKLKLFAQYWGQNIVADGFVEGDTCSVDYAISEGIYVRAWLELKPLSSITEEQVKSLNYPTWIEFIAFNEDSKYLTSPIADKLREWGFAIDWNGVSVEEQIQRGWVKLKEN